MEELKPCPFCGGEPFVENEVKHEGAISMDGYIAKCKSCWCQTDLYALKEYAHRAWNRRLTPAEPLTFEQFKEICKVEPNKIHEPVWIMTLDDKKYSCHISFGLIKADHRYKEPLRWIDAHRVNLFLSDYGKTWLAYTHKPESDAANG